MRRFMLLAALCAALVLALTPAVMAQSRGPSGADGTYNCADFDDQGQAQEFSLSDPGDTNGLDEDGDGTVCESLPTAAPGGNNDTVLIPGEGEATPTGTQYGQSNAETPIIENPRNCDEFGGSQAAAQQFLENATPGDEFNLDADDDGIACEGLLSGGAEAPTTTATQYETPVATTTTTTTPLPDTGGLPLVPLASLLVLGLAGFAVRRRVS